MKLYKRQIKYEWYGFNDRGSPPLEKETEWEDEDIALSWGIMAYNNGHTSCIEKERFVEVIKL